MTYSYSEIKYSYLTVQAFLLPITGEKPDLSTKIAEGLGFWGDDNSYLLTEFVETFQLAANGFNYHEHFEDEGELFNSYAILLAFPRLITWLLYELAIRGGCEIPRPEWLEPKTTNPRKDLTVGDLMAWHLKGDFCLRETELIRFYPT